MSSPLGHRAAGRLRVARRGVALALLLALPAACSAAADSDEGDRLTVFAAASLHEVFADLAPGFEADSEIDVAFSFAGSSDLVAQVDAGAPADVLVTADERTMDDAASAGLLDGDPVPLASNSLVLVTPPDNPAGITGLDDSLSGASLVVCAPQLPCGALTTTVAERRGVTLSPVSEEPSVTAVLSKVTSGQADAGLVYASDAVGAEVRTIAIPGAEEVRTTYLAAVVDGAANPRGARAWLERLQAPESRTVLERAGFGAPG